MKNAKEDWTPEDELVFEPDITCPRCGEKQYDSWDEGNEGEIECYECNITYSFTRNIEETYSMEVIDD